MRRAEILAIGLLVGAAGPVVAQSADEVAYVRDMFQQMQRLSFQKGVEVCGFVGYDRDGRLAHSGPETGDYATCDMDWPGNLTVIASYHTHGLFDPDYVAEMPSDQDMLSDQSMAVNGWVATPGGRLWHVDSARMTTRQICMQSCLPRAPGYDPATDGSIAKSYDFDQLVRRLNE